MRGSFVAYAMSTVLGVVAGIALSYGLGFHGHAVAIDRVAVSPDGRTLTISYIDQSVSLRIVETSTTVDIRARTTGIIPDLCPMCEPIESVVRLSRPLGQRHLIDGGESIPSAPTGHLFRPAYLPFGLVHVGDVADFGLAHSNESYQETYQNASMIATITETSDLRMPYPTGTVRDRPAAIGRDSIEWIKNGDMITVEIKQPTPSATMPAQLIALADVLD